MQRARIAILYKANGWCMPMRKPPMEMLRKMRARLLSAIVRNRKNFANSNCEGGMMQGNFQYNKMVRLVNWYKVLRTTEADCVCLKPPFHFSDFKETLLGTDQRYADIELLICKRCYSHWLKYAVQYESFSGSGRWYRGLLSPSTSKKICPKEAPLIIANLPWYFFGGPYFGHCGKRGRGDLYLEP
jgi:hypothetical protein